MDVLESARFIASNSENVHVDVDGVEAIAGRIYDLYSRNIDNPSWSENQLHPKTKDESTLNWIFTVDTLNFSFYGDDVSKPSQKEYLGKVWTGYWSICAILNDALDRGIPITSPIYWTTASEQELVNIFAGQNMVKERINNLREAGQYIIDHHAGSIQTMVESCNGNAQKLIELMTSKMSSFNDISSYKGREVKFFKRVQIFIADVWACFEGNGVGAFEDIDTITMFADYRVPQIMHYLGMLSYSPKLITILQDKQDISTDLECEIRGCSIHACDLMQNILRTKYSAQINNILLDFFLWNTAKANPDMPLPHHRLRTIFY